MDVCLSRENTRREDRYTDVDCSRTAEFDRGRQAPDIVLDLGRAYLGGGRWRGKEGVFLYSSATSLAFFSFRVQFLSNPVKNKVIECACVCACMHACGCLYIYVCLYVCMHLCMYVYSFAFMICVCF